MIGSSSSSSSSSTSSTSSIVIYYYTFLNYTVACSHRVQSPAVITTKGTHLVAEDF